MMLINDALEEMCEETVVM